MSKDVVSDRPSRSLTTVLVLLVVACGTDAPAGLADEPRAYGPEGVNVFATSDALTHVVELDVLPDGSVWLLNSVEPYFVGFDAAGALIGAHGTEGGGPEEVRRPVGLVTGGFAGEAWAFDSGRHLLVRISTPGAWAEIALPADSIPPMSLIGGTDVTFVAVRLARAGESLIVPRTTLASGGMTAMWRSIWSADLVRFDRAEQQAETVVSLGRVLGDPLEALPELGDFPPFPLWFRLFTVCPNSEIRVYDRLRNEVRAFSLDGSELAPVALPAPSVRSVSVDDFARATLEGAAMLAAGSVDLTPPRIDTVEHMRLMRQVIDADADDLGTLLPRYTDLRCGDDGALWIRSFDLDVGGLHGGPDWIRISTDGRTTEVHMPPRFDPHRFTADRIWGVRRDAYDVPSVAWLEW